MKITIYEKIDEKGKRFYSWDEKTDGGYYNLESMMRLKNLSPEDVKVVYAPLTAYKITYADGSTSSTNMAANVTLEDARKYFIGQRINIGLYGKKENMQTAVDVEKID